MEKQKAQEIIKKLQEFLHDEEVDLSEGTVLKIVEAVEAIRTEYADQLGDRIWTAILRSMAASDEEA